MSVLTRILWWVNLGFLLTLALVLTLLLLQGREDVLREQDAMKPVVESLIASGNAPDMLALIGSSLRHVRLLEKDSEVAGTSSADSLPHWFASFFRHPDHEYQLSFTGYDGESWTLVPDDTDEIREVWQSAVALFWLFLGGALVSNLAIVLGVRSGLSPLTDILEALDAVEKGRLATRLRTYSLPEANQVAAHFNQMACALEQAERENKSLTRTLMSVQEQERAALARDLHDGLGQYITGMRAQAWMIPYQAEDPEALKQLSDALSSACESLDQGFRGVIHKLYPVALDQLGLQAAVDDFLAEIERLSPGVECSRMGTFPDWLTMGSVLASVDMQTHLYRIIQEAVHNAIRHGFADQVCVRLSALEGEAVLDVDDNGKGQLPFKSGFGLRSMEERARMLKGRLLISPFGCSGVKVSVSIPLDQNKDAAESMHAD